MRGLRLIAPAVACLLVLAAQPAQAQSQNAPSHLRTLNVVTPNKPAEEPEAENTRRIWNKYKALAAGTETTEGAQGGEDGQDIEKAQAGEPQNEQEIDDETRKLKMKASRGKSNLQAAEPAAQNAQPAADAQIETPQPGGLARLMQQYQTNKDTRGQMRHLTVTPDSKETVQAEKARKIKMPESNKRQYKKFLNADGNTE